jgi:Arc/MetJ-type ribon-helix-helix transcriptional regulator
MGYQFPPFLERLISERMTAGGYTTEDELLLDAVLALEDIEQRSEELRTEISRRLADTGTVLSQPLDRQAFKAEARRRLSQTS